MWHPNWHQWTVIWTSVILAFLLWLDVIAGGNMLQHLSRFFTGSLADEEELAKAYAVFIIVAGGLLVWMLEGRKANRPPPK